MSIHSVCLNFTTSNDNNSSDEYKSKINHKHISTTKLGELSTKFNFYAATNCKLDYFSFHLVRESSVCIEMAVLVK